MWHNQAFLTDLCDRSSKHLLGERTRDAGSRGQPYGLQTLHIPLPTETLAWSWTGEAGLKSKAEPRAPQKASDIAKFWVRHISHSSKIQLVTPNMWTSVETEEINWDWILGLKLCFQCGKTRHPPVACVADRNLNWVAGLRACCSDHVAKQLRLTARIYFLIRFPPWSCLILSACLVSTFFLKRCRSH